MKITNKSNLPLPLVRAILNDPYSRGDCDFSTTMLIKPPRIVALETRHADELEEDASDRIWALIGQLGHLVLERAGMEELVERRFKATIRGKTVGGQVDLWKNEVLLDYKFTKLWSAVHGVKKEWEQQANVNAFLCAGNGVTVKRAQIVCVFLDWSVGEARRNRDYPQAQVRMLEVPLWPPLDQLEFIEDQMEMHLAAQDILPECTPLERWAKGEKWAVMKKGGKRALVLCDTEAEAKTHIKIEGGMLYVEHRPPINVRCEDYCSVSGWCDQFKKLKEEK